MACLPGKGRIGRKEIKRFLFYTFRLLQIFIWKWRVVVLRSYGEKESTVVMKNVLFRVLHPKKKQNKFLFANVLWKACHKQPYHNESSLSLRAVVNRDLQLFSSFIVPWSVCTLHSVVPVLRWSLLVSIRLLCCQNSNTCIENWVDSNRACRYTARLLSCDPLYYLQMAFSQKRAFPPHHHHTGNGKVTQKFILCIGSFKHKIEGPVLSNFPAPIQPCQ